MPSRKFLLIAALLAVSTAVVAKPSKKPPVAPASAKACEECHGSNGVSTAPGIPHLNGQIPENIVESLEQFQRNKRPSTTPAHTDPALTAEEAGALARFYSYYGPDKAQRPAQQTDPAKVAEAEAVYQRRCAKCHVNGGREADHDAPLVAGQSLQYLQAQTQAFVAGKRKFPYLMDEAYQGLSPDDLERLSHYFASQGQ